MEKIKIPPTVNKEKGKKNILLISVCIAASLALIAGLVLGIFTAIASIRSVMEYNGVRLDKKVASYLVSTYKVDHIASLKRSGIAYAEDTPEFWARQNPDGTGTFGEGLARSAEQYLKEILVGVYLYDRGSELDAKTEDAIKKKAAEVPEYFYGTEGFDVLFETDAAAMGYDYESYLEAAVMLYKSEMACSAIYGSSGENASAFPTECGEFLNLMYTHAQLLFIRTETTFVLDENGNRVTVAGGYKLDYVNDGKQRSDDIKTLKQMVDAYNNDTEGSEVLTPGTIEAYAKSYSSDQAADRIDKGYYFSAYSEYTASFFEEAALRTVLDKATAMEIDETGKAFGYCELELNSLGDNNTEKVWCFIFKSAPEVGAYADSTLSDFFTDFYSDAATLYLYPREVIKRSAEVKVKDKFGDISATDLPANDKHRIKELLGN